jgi:hypothetical protein
MGKMFGRKIFTDHPGGYDCLPGKMDYYRTKVMCLND